MNKNKTPIDIIGIAGKMNSGKDLVGQIIQYLTSPNAKNKGTFEECLNNGYTYDIEYDIEKFASTLKDIVCLIIGCTREDLENEEFKNSDLGSAWKKQFSFSNSDDGLTPRKLMQLLATDCFRDTIHPDIWINSLFRKFKAIDLTKIINLNGVLDYSECGFPKWIITDVRFVNEVDAIKLRSGIIIKLKRNLSEKSVHVSEIEIDDSKVDYIVYNNGTIQELVDKIKSILKKEKII